MARVYADEHHTRVERVLYRVMGVDPDADQRWPVYARVPARLLVRQRAGPVHAPAPPAHLPLSLGFPGVAPDQAFNTAASFVTNTNWQSYSGESTMGHLAQMAGLAVQNFVSAAVGMAVAVALVRGFTRARTDRIGNFWVDLVRGTLRILLPIAVLGTLVLVALGAVQNLAPGTEVTTLAGQSQTITGGPVASQEAIKELGTNGGRLLQRQLRPPLREPHPAEQPARDLPAPADPGRLTRTFGVLVGDKRQGYACSPRWRVIWARARWSA